MAVVDYLLSRKELDSEKILGYGVSFGAAALIHAAAEDKRLKLIIVDSPFAEFEVMAKKVVERMLFIPTVLRNTLGNLGLSFANLELGFNLKKHSPLSVISEIGQPILIIHGKNDPLIPWTEADKLFKAANNPKEFLVLPGLLWMTDEKVIW